MQEKTWYYEKWVGRQASSSPSLYVKTLLEVIPNNFINLLLLEGGSRGSEKMMMHIIIFSWSTSLLTSLLSVTK